MKYYGGEKNDDVKWDEYANILPDKEYTYTISSSVSGSTRTYYHYLNGVRLYNTNSSTSDYNGRKAQSHDVAYISDGTSNYISFGNTRFADNFTGEFKWLRRWDNALTETEVYNNYQNESIFGLKIIDNKAIILESSDNNSYRTYFTKSNNQTTTGERTLITNHYKTGTLTG